MGLVALALVARHLGPGGFGVIALLQSYIFTINWLVNFQACSDSLCYSTLERN
jgi:O-antigen/teichoic acid export membrane protein